VGREKDTIVLSSGENIDPLPLEEALRKNMFIERVIIVGQDRKGLGALIVPIPDNIKSWAKDNLDSDVDPVNDYDKLLKHPKVRRHYQKILDQTLSYQNGFKEYERVHYFCLLPETFTIGEELTPTLKLKRRYIRKKYARHIDRMYTL
jgi:long-chain acyl-CoA synthetase